MSAEPWTPEQEWSGRRDVATARRWLEWARQKQAEGRPPKRWSYNRVESFVRMVESLLATLDRDRQVVDKCGTNQAPREPKDAEN